MDSFDTRSRNRSLSQSPTTIFGFLFLCSFLCLGVRVDLFAGDQTSEGDQTNEGDLTHEIDELIRRAWKENGISPAATCSDRIFVRRVYLDLAGRVPNQEETDSFLAESDLDKRESLIDTLLQSEDFASHFADLFDALLMGRAEESKYDARAKHGWKSYLETVFRENRPWEEVAAEILTARPTSKDNRGAVWFLYERENKHQEIAEAVAPAFFGIRIECAQCHDHMSVDEILQEHYWGLVAFFNRGKNANTPNGPRIAESAIGGFSEFANLSGESSPNVLSFLDADTVSEMRPAKDEKQVDSDELYQPASLEKDPRVPKFSRRQAFVDHVLKGHPLLARAMVNRLWAILMGRGIVHPFDELDSMHPASHPELLERLAEDFAESKFDIRRMLRMIARSEAYQLDSTRPRDVNDPATFAWYLERPLTAEQLARSTETVLRNRTSKDSPLMKSFRQRLVDVLPDAIEVPISESLYWSNNEALQRFINDSTGDGDLLRRLADLSGHPERADLLTGTLFGRDPDREETQSIVAYLESREDRLHEALAQVTWSLLTSAEFRFNH